MNMNICGYATPEASFQSPHNYMQKATTIGHSQTYLSPPMTTVYHIYLTPPLGQDMTQGQFLSGV